MSFRRIPFLMENADPPAGGPPAPAPAADPQNPNPDPPAPAAGTHPPDVVARELEKARKDAAAYRERLRKFEIEAEEKQKAALAEQGKFKELYEAEKAQREAVAKERDAYVSEFQSVAEAEIATVPEQFRDLIPAGTEAQKLKWVREAKAKGLFAAPAPSVPPRPPATPPTAPPPAGGSGGKRTFTTREIEEMSFTDREKLMPEILAAAREGRIVEK
jgi:hypothetical protein